MTMHEYLTAEDNDLLIHPNYDKPHNRIYWQCLLARPEEDRSPVVGEGPSVLAAVVDWWSKMQPRAHVSDEKT